jgi:hypothetical protein
MSASNRRIADLINDIEEGKLVIKPYFQRRLVWTNTDKEKFIETVLKKYPFPEIFIATGSLDLDQIKRQNWLVDGQQRISTLLNYVRVPASILNKLVRKFSELTESEKTEFLDYEVAVRDLGTVGEAKIKDIFQRINSTDYALKSMEKLNAMYGGVLSQFCEKLSRHEFFILHNVFTDANKKRMYDVTFCVILVVTILAGYFRRAELNSEYLERYNDDFPLSAKVESGLEEVFRFIDSCNFHAKSRAWKQTDLFTLIVELYSILVEQRKTIDSKRVGPAIIAFYNSVDSLSSSPGSIESNAQNEPIFRYLKASTKATNDKYARTERAAILLNVLNGNPAAIE